MLRGAAFQAWRGGQWSPVLPPRRSRIHPGLWVMLGEVPSSRQLQLFCFWSSKAGEAPRKRGGASVSNKGTPDQTNARARGFISTRRVGPQRCRVCACWPLWSMSWRALHRLLSAFLTCLSCPSVCLRPLCPGAALPAPGGSVGSVNGYHTCKGELAVHARACRGCLTIFLSVFVCAFPSVRI